MIIFEAMTQMAAIVDFLSPEDKALNALNFLSKCTFIDVEQEYVRCHSGECTIRSNTVIYEEKFFSSLHLPSSKLKLSYRKIQRKSKKKRDENRCAQRWLLSKEKLHLFHFIQRSMQSPGPSEWDTN